MIRKGEIPTNQKYHSALSPKKQELRDLCKQALANTRHLQQLCLSHPHEKLPPILQTRQVLLENLTRTAFNNMQHDNDEKNNSKEMTLWNESKINIYKISFDRNHSLQIKGRRKADSETEKKHPINNPIAFTRRSSSHNLQLNPNLLKSNRSQQLSTEDLMQHIQATQAKPQNFYPSIFHPLQTKPDQLKTLEHPLSSRNHEQIFSTIGSNLSKIQHPPTRNNFNIDLSKITYYNHQRTSLKRRIIKEASKDFGRLEPWQRNPEEDLILDY